MMLMNVAVCGTRIFNANIWEPTPARSQKFLQWELNYFQNNHNKKIEKFLTLFSVIAVKYL